MDGEIQIEMPKPRERIEVRTNNRKVDDMQKYVSLNTQSNTNEPFIYNYPNKYTLDEESQDEKVKAIRLNKNHIQ